MGCASNAVGAVNPVAEIAARFTRLQGLRQTLSRALAAIQDNERTLSEQLVAGVQRSPGVRVYGITDKQRLAQRATTVSFTLDGYTPSQVAQELGAQNIYVWDGNYYVTGAALHGAGGRGALQRPTGDRARFAGSGPSGCAPGVLFLRAAYSVRLCTSIFTNLSR